MNIIKRISAFSACAGLMLVGLGSCSNDDIDYSSGTYPDAPEAYFSIQDSHALTVGNDNSEFLLTVYRVSTDAPATVKLSWSGDIEPFDLPETVTFGENDVVAEIAGYFDTEEMEPLATYNVTVEIPGTVTTPYTQNSVAYAFTYAPMSEWAPVGEYDGLGTYEFYFYYEGYVEDPVLVLERHSLVDENQVEYNFCWLYDYDDPESWEVFLTAESSDGGETITVPVQLFTVDEDWGPVYVADLATYTGTDDFEPSYFDPEEGVFYLDVIYWDAEGPWGYGYEYCNLYGYDNDTEDARNIKAPFKPFNSRKSARKALKPSGLSLGSFPMPYFGK